MILCCCICGVGTTTATAPLCCRASRGSDTAGASHGWSPDIRRGCDTGGSCTPRKPAGKDSAGASRCSTGLWRKVMPRHVVPLCRCGRVTRVTLWVLTTGILVPQETRKLQSQRFAWAVHKNLTTEDVRAAVWVKWKVSLVHVSSLTVAKKSHKRKASAERYFTRIFFQAPAIHGLPGS